MRVAFWERAFEEDGIVFFFFSFENGDVKCKQLKEKASAPTAEVFVNVCDPIRTHWDWHLKACGVGENG